MITTAPVSSELVTSFTLSVPQSDLDDLREHLLRTRWPDPETVADTSQGPKLDKIQRLVDYWATEYDWRKTEALLNGWGQYTTIIDGLEIHFVHILSQVPGARPLLLTHGWPGSVLEFRHAIGPLTDPVAHGGSTEDAFDVIIPSLPGFGFSGHPTGTGWNLHRTAQAWATLMRRLGYTTWFAQGGDWAPSSPPSWPHCTARPTSAWPGSTSTWPRSCRPKTRCAPPTPPSRP